LTTHVCILVYRDGNPWHDILIDPFRYDPAIRKFPVVRGRLLTGFYEINQYSSAMVLQHANRNVQHICKTFRAATCTANSVASKYPKVFGAPERGDGLALACAPDRWRGRKHAVARGHVGKIRNTRLSDSA
jgi:hypothetical protein